MSDLTLISHPLCPYVQRAAIVLTEKRVLFSRRMVDLSNKPDWFLAISPLGKTPVLMVQTTAIFESSVICEFLEDSYGPALHPADPLLRAHHRSWVEFASELLTAIGRFYNAGDKPSLQKNAELIRYKLSQAEAELGAGLYFDGHRFSIVDAAWGPVFRYFDVFEQIGDFGFFDELTKVSRWRESIAQRPSVRSAVSDDYPELLKQFIRNRQSELSRCLNVHSARLAHWRE